MSDTGDCGPRVPPGVYHLVNALPWASRVTVAEVVISAPASLAVERAKDHTAAEWQGFSQALCWYLSSLFRDSASWCFPAPVWVRRADAS